MVSIEIKRWFIGHKCKWLLRVILTFHKYAVSLLLLIFLGASFITGTDFYIDNYYVIDEFYFIFMLLYLVADAIIRDKCLWHYASIFGLLVSSITNIAFYDDYGDTYIHYYSQGILGGFTVAMIILALFFNDKAKSEL